MPKSKTKKPKRSHNDEQSEVEKETIKVHSELEKIHFKVQNKYKLSDVHNSFYGLCLQKDSKVFFVDGVAGSAKSYTAVYAALSLLSRGDIEKIFYVRSAVESASRSLGFLPGELEEKFQPWLIPLLDKMEELVDPMTQGRLLGEKYIEAAPINYWRGRTAKN
jgi:phosphate starvation-inducible PhoH-like protein